MNWLDRILTQFRRQPETAPAPSVFDYITDPVARQVDQARTDPVAFALPIGAGLALGWLIWGRK